MRHTKIVATIGPASKDLETLVAMVEAGMDVARLNFSHGTRDDHAQAAQNVRVAAKRVGRRVAIMQDLPGPKLRIGELSDGLVELRPGDQLTLLCGSKEIGDTKQVAVSWRGLVDAVQEGDVLFIADGAVRLRVEKTSVAEGKVETRIEIGGPVSSRQGLNIPTEAISLPSVSKEDLQNIAFAKQLGIDLIALSFIRSPSDVEFARQHTDIPLVAKIEKPQALDNAKAIIKAADCVMVARGDLGIELEIEQVPLAQKRILKIAGALARPSITATQMLNSMVASPRPTRAEATDIANAILDGTDAIMLSQETAVGKYPVEAVQTMASIAKATETTAPYEYWNDHRVQRDPRDPAYTIAHMAAGAVRQLLLSALIVPTLSGRSARLISAHRPRVPIYALSPSTETVQRCNLMWGVRAQSMRYHHVTEELIADCARQAVEFGWVRPGDRVGITAGLPSGTPGTTSLFQVQDI
jgi:pyruvate kinase